MYVCDDVEVYRFLLSLADCSHCIVVDDHLNVLPISSHILSLTPLPPKVSIGVPLLSE